MIQERHYSQINDQLEEQSKVVIGVGCSFVAGMGAWDSKIFENYNVTVDTSKGNRCVVEDPIENKKMQKEYGLSIVFDDIDVSVMELRNSFVYQLAEKLDYTPINCGMSGNGNRSSISQLYLHNKINWDAITGGVLVYCPSGMERFDFANDQGIDNGFSHIGIWPNPNSVKVASHEGLGYQYGSVIYSDKFCVIEQLTYVQQLVNFCKLKNLKLIITPGFDERYNKKYFKDVLSTSVQRDHKGIRVYSDQRAPERIISLAESFPWNNMFKPQGCNTFIDLCLKQEGLSPTKSMSYFPDYLHKGSPNYWVSPCAHPTKKSHTLFAEELEKCLSL